MVKEYVTCENSVKARNAIGVLSVPMVSSALIILFIPSARGDPVSTVVHGIPSCVTVTMCVPLWSFTSGLALRLVFDAG